MKLVLTCEHAGNKIPKQFRELFKGREELMSTHRAYDPGAFSLFKKLQPLSHQSFSHKWSRLVVEVNRSKGHSQLFSEFTKNLPEKLKETLLQKFYFPYRNEVERCLESVIDSGEITLHLSVHSFTPILEGKKRKTAIGLLYDPARIAEKNFCKEFKNELHKQLPEIKIRFNYPYLGKADGFTTYLRKRFPEHYLGVEIEVNQNLLENGRFPEAIENGIYSSLKKLIS